MILDYFLLNGTRISLLILKFDFKSIAGVRSLFSPAVTVVLAKFEGGL